MIPKPVNPLDKVPKELFEKLPDEDIRAIQAGHDWHLAATELANLNNQLHEDFKEIVRIGAQDNPKTDWWKRSAYRAMFAWIEGYVYGMKQVVLRAYMVGTAIELSRSELSFLYEETYSIDKGKTRTKNVFVRLESNIRFTFSVFERIYNLEPMIDAGSQDWQNFCSAIEVRNRLTHPKAAEDLNVTEKELMLLTFVLNWFSQLSATAAKDATSYTQELREIKKSQQEQKQSKYFAGVRQKLGQLAIVENAQKMVDSITGSEGELFLSKDAVNNLAQELNTLRQQLAEELQERSKRKE